MLFRDSSKMKEKINKYDYPYHWALYGFSRWVYEESFKLSKIYLMNKNVVDLGCGDGRLTYLISTVAKNVVGVDNQKIAISFAKSIANNINKNIKFIRADSCKKLKQMLKKFDVVTAYDIIEHIPEDKVKEFLSAVRYYLKDGGAFILTTPNILELRGRLLGHKINDKHYKEYNLQEIILLLENSGFEVLDKRGIYLTLPMPKFIDFLHNLLPFNIFFYGMIKIGKYLLQISKTIFIMARLK